MTQKISMILVLTLLLSFSTAFAKWKLVQNSPTTNDLHSVYFHDDNIGWIAGDNSTISKTTNSGESWVQQTSPEASNFQCITFLNADTGWACGTSGVVIKTTDGGANWFSQTFTASQFNSMTFFDADTGYIAGDFGNIRKTIDGGSNWTIMNSGVSQNLHQIVYERPSTRVFVIGDNAIVSYSDNGYDWQVLSGPGFGGQTLYTIDLMPENQPEPVHYLSTGTVTKQSSLGAVWYLGAFPMETIYSLAYMGGGRFCGVGANGYIVNTFDFGTSWEPEESPTAQNLYSVHYQDSSNFLWAVGAGGTIVKNTPNWIRQDDGDAWPLYSVYFTDANTGFAVGAVGTILKTTNSGTNWIEQTTPTAVDLNSIEFIDADTGYVVGTSGTILKTSNGGTDWTPQTSPILTSLLSVYFTDANTGFAVGLAGTILKTINGGNEWFSLPSPTLNTLISVYFGDANTGYVVGEAGTILKTSNSGADWIAQTSTTTNRLNSVYFIDANTGYVVGQGNTLLKTTDGGANWVTQFIQSSITPSNFLSVNFIDANLGYVCTSSKIHKTSNGGIDWYQDEFSITEYTGNLYDIQFVVSNDTVVGFAVGDQIHRTSFEYINGDVIGNSGSYPGWVPVNSETTGNISSVEYINPFVAFGVGGDPGGVEQGLVLRTINGGQTWTRQQSNLAAFYLSDVSFADVNNGIAVGGFGSIVHTTNAGIDWVLQTSGTTSTIESVDMLDVNNAFACGTFGTMLHTSNAGISWEKQTNGTSGSWNDVDYIDSITATAVGFTGKIIRTTDAGLNWVEQTGGGNLSLSRVRFIDVNNGIAVSNEGPVLRTTNGGADWVQTDSLSGYASDISYPDSNNVFVFTHSGGVNRVYHSSDGGISWELQIVNTTENLLGLSFADANNGILVGQNGLILRTSNGGVISEAAAAFKRNGLNLTIDDFLNTSDSIDVDAALKSSLSDAVARVYVTIDTVLHPNDGDLEFYLEHNGVIDTLIYRCGGSGDNFLGTFLNDETNFSVVSGTAPFRGSFEPYRPLSKFDGQNPSGYWTLRIYDRATGNTGSLEAWSLTLMYKTITDVAEGEDLELPLRYQLSQNYPNPFNPVTTIQYSLPERSQVTIEVFNVLGQKVRTLVSREESAGSYTITWNGVDASGQSVATGVYLYRFQAGDHVDSKKMVLLK